MVKMEFSKPGAEAEYAQAITNKGYLHLCKTPTDHVLLLLSARHCWGDAETIEVHFGQLLRYRKRIFLSGLESRFIVLSSTLCRLPASLRSTLLRRSTKGRMWINYGSFHSR